MCPHTMWRDRDERLGSFTHPDFVTSVQFHPLNDHIFLTGCFDKRLRLWTVTNGRWDEIVEHRWEANLPLCSAAWDENAVLL